MPLHPSFNLGFRFFRSLSLALYPLATSASFVQSSDPLPPFPLSGSLARVILLCLCLSFNPLFDFPPISPYSTADPCPIATSPSFVQSSVPLPPFPFSSSLARFLLLYMCPSFNLLFDFPPISPYYTAGPCPSFNPAPLVASTSLLLPHALPSAHALSSHRHIDILLRSIRGSISSVSPRWPEAYCCICALHLIR